MLISEALTVYKSRHAIAEAAGVSVGATYQWGDDLIPPLSAAKLAKRSRGKLRFDPDRYDGWNNRKTPS